MIALVICAALAAAAPPAAAAPSTSSKARVFVLDLQTSSVEPAVVSALTGALVEDLARYTELVVLSKEDVRRAIALEADKQTMGCAEESCLAEAAAAMGAELALFGEVQRVEGAYVAQLNLLDVASVESRARVSVRGGTFDELTRAVPGQLRALMTSTYAARGWTLPEAPASAGPSALPYVVAGVSGAAAVAGLVVAGLGTLPFFWYEDARGRIAVDADASQTADRSAALTDAIAARKDADAAAGAWGTWGIGLVVTGAVVAVAGLAGVAGGVAWALAGDAE